MIEIQAMARRAKELGNIQASDALNTLSFDPRLPKSLTIEDFRFRVGLIGEKNHRVMHEDEMVIDTGLKAYDMANSEGFPRVPYITSLEKPHEAKNVIIDNFAAVSLYAIDGSFDYPMQLAMVVQSFGEHGDLLKSAYQGRLRPPMRATYITIDPLEEDFGCSYRAEVKKVEPSGYRIDQIDLRPNEAGSRGRNFARTLVNEVFKLPEFSPQQTPAEESQAA